jgi:oligopeptide/dipeptide ABC transporter ATP-binding protein
MIAMAIARSPAVLLADEPTTALDVTIAAQVLSLLRDLRRRMGMGLVLVTHDMGVVAQHADVAAVMYHGRIVEYATVFDLFASPLHPYTKGLLKAVPRLGHHGSRLATLLEGVSESDMNVTFDGQSHRAWWPTETSEGNLVEARHGRWVRLVADPAQPSTHPDLPLLAHRTSAPPHNLIPAI